MAKGQAVFDIESIKDILNRLSEKKFPYFRGQISTLGGKERPSTLLAISLDPQVKWKNGIFENSNYIRISIDYQGEVEEISRSNTLIKFRKFTVKDSDTVIAKISKYVDAQMKMLSSRETAAANYKPKLTPKRAKEILAIRARTLLGQGDLQKIMSEEEYSDLNKYWNTLSGNMSLSGALEKIAKMKTVTAPETASVINFSTLVNHIKGIFKAWNVKNPNEGLKFLWIGSEQKPENSLAMQVVSRLLSGKDLPTNTLINALANDYVEYCLAAGLLKEKYNSEKEYSKAIVKSFTALMPKLLKKLNSNSSGSNMAGYDDERLSIFCDLYKKNLVNYITKNPEIFRMQGKTEQEIINRANAIAELSIKTMKESNHGIKMVDLSPSIKKTAVMLKIKPTFKDIEDYLLG